MVPGCVFSSLFITQSFVFPFLGFPSITDSPSDPGNLSLISEIMPSETFNITINSYDALQFTSDNGEENSLAIVDVSVSNNTIYLDVSFSNSAYTYQEFANRTSLSNPCE